MSHQRFGKRTSRGGPLFPDLEFGACQAVRAGNSVFLVGLTGLDITSRVFTGKGDPAAQAENAMQVCKASLEMAGARMEDICKITTYVTEHEYRALVYPVLARHLEGVYPVSTGLVVKGLAEDYMDFEIDVFAVIPEDRSQPG
jgi:enamine deaminase RidA (YjgF/YER057c/UK114 family)